MRSKCCLGNKGRDPRRRLERSGRKRPPSVPAELCSAGRAQSWFRFAAGVTAATPRGAGLAAGCSGGPGRAAPREAPGLRPRRGWVPEKGPRERPAAGGRALWPGPDAPRRGPRRRPSRRASAPATFPRPKTNATERSPGVATSLEEEMWVIRISYQSKRIYI